MDAEQGADAVRSVRTPREAFGWSIGSDLLEHATDHVTRRGPPGAGHRHEGRLDLE